MSLVNVLIIVVLLFSVSEAFFRCPKNPKDGKGLVEISATASFSSFTVSWHTNDLDAVDLVNLEYKCYPKEQRDNHTRDKTIVFVPLSQRLSGKQEIKVNTNNESMECEISGCYIDYEWGNANSIEKKIITIGELLSPSPTISLSPTPSVLVLSSSSAVCSCSMITESKVVPSCTITIERKKRSTMQNEEEDSHNTGSTLSHQSHSGVVSGLLGILIVAVCVLALTNIMLVLNLKAKKSAKLDELQSL